MEMKQMPQEWLRSLAPTNFSYSQLGDMTQVWVYNIERAHFVARWDALVDGQHKTVAPGCAFNSEAEIDAYQGKARAAFGAEVKLP